MAKCPACGKDLLQSEDGLMTCPDCGKKYRGTKRPVGENGNSEISASEKNAENQTGSLSGREENIEVKIGPRTMRSPL